MTRKKRNPNMERLMSAVAILFRQDCTAVDLWERLETSQRDQAYDYIHAMRWEGLIYIKGWKKNSKGGHLSAIYSFQHPICPRLDAEKPNAVRVRRKVDRARIQTNQGEAASSAQGMRPMQEARDHFHHGADLD
jgi:hypothetical protein